MPRGPGIDPFNDDPEDDLDHDAGHDGAGVGDGVGGELAVRGADGALMEVAPPTFQERMAQLENAPGLAEQAQADPDEALFAALDAQWGDDDDDEFGNGAPPGPARAAIYAPPMPAELVAAGLLGGPDAGGAPQGGAAAGYANPRLEGGAGGALRAAPAPGALQVGGGGRGMQVAQGAARTWRPLFELPGYGAPGRQGEAVRAMGRAIFGSLPCFRVMQAECRAQGRDPLGEVQVMANIGGAGPSTPAQISAMAAWVRREGMMVDAAHIEFPMVMPGYRPEIMLAASDTDSFLMVNERRATGAHMDSLYIYSWRGGRGVYLNDDMARNALQNMGGRNAQRIAPPQGGIAAAMPALAPPVPLRAEPPAPPAAPHGAVNPDVAAAHPIRVQQPPAPAAPVVAAHLARAPARAAPPVAPPPAAPDPLLPQRVERGRAAAVPAARVNALQLMSANGFATVGTAQGPARRKELPDGGYVQVLGEGRPLTMATSFRVSRHDEGGTELENLVLEGGTAVVEWAQDKAMPVARPAR